MLSQDKKQALERRMASLGVFEDDLIEKFIRGTGSGGQKVNKTSSCVFLQHPTSKIEVKVQRERSREMNRFLAREELCSRLEEIAEKKKTGAQAGARKSPPPKAQTRSPCPRPQCRKETQARAQKRKPSKTGVSRLNESCLPALFGQHFPQ